MLSILAFSGIAFGVFDATDHTTEDETGVQAGADAPDAAGGPAELTDTEVAASLLDPLLPDTSLEAGGALAGSETLDFGRGDTIEGFDPASDTLELEYSAAMGLPEVSVLDFADGAGASVALNGVVVADLPGVTWLDAADVKLIAV